MYYCTYKYEIYISVFNIRFLKKLILLHRTHFYYIVLSRTNSELIPKPSNVGTHTKI
ncbi:hypothetical protein LEP1GSC075_4152 [Leptospira interrogans str. Kito]|nr:hypothetical protein LEP1GSC014_4394 [Leptospira interrogans serovar Pomona str. Pomona]EKO68281.1 hypothetical protein LEP1GSC069_0526 [Leptospira interrogans serovar Canicola str. Fiocruz LV133]EKR81996.1 hypothetical protein LEP1GSC099_2543 [Leptospira interrogans str. UI 08452]EMK16615.1 hypothetical protein LEP1GSC075_4152 [Leptospira interrogans str. Kito]EMN33665.1 hypothetical protein LEP1GSC084_0932 [Leptospira interrogans serovar Medanensis str. L0448]EMN76552.1 hypothetical prote